MIRTKLVLEKFAKIYHFSQTSTCHTTMCRLCHHDLKQTDITAIRTIFFRMVKPIHLIQCNDSSFKPNSLFQVITDLNRFHESNTAIKVFAEIL